MQVKKNSKIFLDGKKGMVGSSILRYLRKKKYKKIYTVNKKKVDLLDQKKTEKYLKFVKPDCVIIAAAKVGGIIANKKNKAEFIYQNLMIQTNLIHSSYKCGVKKLIFLGSSCIYPKYAAQPIKESSLLTGKLENTNDAYAVAKIAGVKMCEAYNEKYGLSYICLMPSNLYGPNDNYDLNNSHFFPALIKKIHNAKENKIRSINLWGDGKAKRELLFVDDLANACEFFMRKKVRHTIINIGSGHEKKISDYAKFIMKKLNIKLNIKLDRSKPNGTPRKILNTKLAKNYGWKSKISLDKGFSITYKNFVKSSI